MIDFIFYNESPQLRILIGDEFWFEFTDLVDQLFTLLLIFDAADYQVQSAKFRNALSLVYLGKEVLRKPLKITKKFFKKVLQAIQDIIQEQAEAPL